MRVARTAHSCALLALQVFHQQSFSLHFRNETRKKILEGCISQILLKTARIFCVARTTNLRHCFNVAIQPVAYVCPQAAKASVFSDRGAVVLNQWLKHSGHNECAEQQTNT